MSYSRSDWTKGLEKTLLSAINGITDKASLQSLALLAASAGCIRGDEQVSNGYATAIAKRSKAIGSGSMSDSVIKTSVFTLVGGVPAYAAKELGLDIKRLQGFKMLTTASEHNAIVTALCEATQPTTVRTLAGLIERTAISKTGLDNVYTALLGATRRLRITDKDIVADIVRAAVSLQPNKLEDVAAKFGQDPKDLPAIVTELQKSAESPEPALARVA